MKFGVPLWNQTLSRGTFPQLRKLTLQFCKRYLEVHNKASNIACRAELGKFPLIIDINKKILSYLNYLHQKDENSIVRQALKISIDLYDHGKNSFYSSVMKINEYYNFNHFNYSSLNDCKIKRYINIMKQKYTSHRNQTLQNSQKLSFYNTIINNYSSSTYLDFQVSLPWQNLSQCLNLLLLKGTWKI